MFKFTNDINLLLGKNLDIWAAYFQLVAMSSLYKISVGLNNNNEKS